MATPRVSVVLPARNAGAYVEEAIRSILAQTFADFELIVLNDGSTDDSAARVARLAAEDARIRFVDRAENHGLVSTLNEGFALARGELIARMDADDSSHPDRLRRQVDFLDAHPDVGICGTYWHYMGTDTVIRPPITHEGIGAFGLSQNPFGHPTVMIRRSTLLALTDAKEPYREEYFTAEDYDLWLRLLEVTRGANLPETLLEYRIHPGQISHASPRQRETTDRIRVRQLARVRPAAGPEQRSLHLKLMARDPLTLSEIARGHRWIRDFARDPALVARYGREAMRDFERTHDPLVWTAHPCVRVPRGIVRRTPVGRLLRLLYTPSGLT